MCSTVPKSCQCSPLAGLGGAEKLLAAAAITKAMDVQGRHALLEDGEAFSALANELANVKRRYPGRKTLRKPPPSIPEDVVLPNDPLATRVATLLSATKRCAELVGDADSHEAGRAFDYATIASRRYPPAI